jgi:undecaprenyl-diphosphatase
MPFDAEIYHLVGSMRGRSPLIDYLMLAFEVGTLKFFYLPLMIFLWLTRKPKLQKAVLVASAVVVACILLRPLVKDFIYRPRPWVEFGCPGLAPCYDDSAFPSGHAMLAFGCMVALWFASRNLGWMMLVVCVLTSISRMYLGEHWPSDLIAGGALGIGLGYGLSVASNYGPFAWGIERALGISRRIKLTEPQEEPSPAPA